MFYRRLPLIHKFLLSPRRYVTKENNVQTKNFSGERIIYGLKQSQEKMKNCLFLGANPQFLQIFISFFHRPNPNIIFSPISIWFAQSMFDKGQYYENVAK